MDSLQTELQAAQLVSLTGSERPEPVAVARVVQKREKPQQPGKQQQPQAHIQPHLHTPSTHTPRDEHRPTQTASVRPMAQRATSQAVVLPTSQVSLGQPEVATVQPTVSVSPSVSSEAGPSQLPSTSQPPRPALLDAGALEFYPVSSKAVVLELEDAAMPGSTMHHLSVEGRRLWSAILNPEQLSDDQIQEITKLTRQQFFQLCQETEEASRYPGRGPRLLLRHETRVLAFFLREVKSLSFRYIGGRLLVSRMVATKSFLDILFFIFLRHPCIPCF